jgi:ankyrin repeat protein
MFAAENGHLEICKFLISANANVSPKVRYNNYRGRIIYWCGTALRKSEKWGTKIKHRQSLRGLRSSATHVFALFADIRVSYFTFEYHVFIPYLSFLSSSSSGRTPLMCAVDTDHVELCKVLISANADVNAVIGYDYKKTFTEFVPRT